MIYVLDTNVCIRYLNGRSPLVRERLQALEAGSIRLCSVVKAELVYGAAKSRVREHTLAKLDRFFAAFESLPFDDRAALNYGEIRADLESQGTPIGPNDLLIAAIALANQATLVTTNTREFARVKGLELENWETSTSGERMGNT